MPSRAKDWLRQADRDLAAAGTEFAAQHYDWACFASQQAAEKALKGLYQHHHAEGWGHVLVRLVDEIASDEPEIVALRDKAAVLDGFYIPTRYPNGFDAGAPCDFLTEAQARQGREYAEAIVSFCKSRCGR